MITIRRASAQGSRSAAASASAEGYRLVEQAPHALSGEGMIGETGS